MKKLNTTDRELLEQFKAQQKNGLQVHGVYDIEITRANGDIEHKRIKNIVTKDGLNAIAELMIGDATGTNSAFKYIVIGSVTAQGSLGSVQGGIGEVTTRKIAATLASSGEVAILVATWAGNTDGLTGVALGSAGIANHASSGSGILGSHVNSVDATLQASDFLKVQVEIQIGSHAL